MRRTALVVDDHRGFRAEARRLLEADGYEVVGEAADCEVGLREASRLRPSLIVLDVGLPDGSGLDLVAPLRGAAPEAVVVLVSGRQEDEYGGRVAASGADAFIDKARLAPGLLAAVHGDRP